MHALPKPLLRHHMEGEMCVFGGGRYVNPFFHTGAAGEGAGGKW